MSRSDPQMKIRLPEALKRRVETSAENARRSMNAEIIDRLEKSFSAWPVVSLPPEMIERANRVDPEQRSAFEVNMSGLVAQMFDTHFAPPKYLQQRIHEALENAVMAKPGIDRFRVLDEAVAEVDELLRRKGLLDD